jgi:hypothetical protein
MSLLYSGDNFPFLSLSAASKRRVNSLRLLSMEEVNFFDLLFAQLPIMIGIDLLDSLCHRGVLNLASGLEIVPL